VTLGLGPLSGVSIGRLGGVGTLWDCVPRVCSGGGGCAGDGVPLGAVPALFWYEEVSLGGILSIVGECIGRPLANGGWAGGLSNILEVCVSGVWF